MSEKNCITGKVSTPSRDNNHNLPGSKLEANIVLAQEQIKYPLEIPDDLFNVLSSSERAAVRVLERNKKALIIVNEDPLMKSPKDDGRCSRID